MCVCGGGARPRRWPHPPVVARGKSTDPRPKVIAHTHPVTPPSPPAAQGDLLEHRVGDLRNTAKVTSLLGIWQHRLHHKQKSAAAKKRDQLVWERQQQLLRQHMRKAHEQESVDLELEQEAPPSPDQGPPMLF
jgi:hypothetical protein